MRSQSWTYRPRAAWRLHSGWHREASLALVIALRRARTYVRIAIGRKPALAARLGGDRSREFKRLPILCGVVQRQGRPALDRETKVRVLPPQLQVGPGWL